MTEFLQLHLLTTYPPSNVNRDDSGRPKQTVFGNTRRLRISSQSLKRAWRESDVFTLTLQNHLGTRTQRLGNELFEYLIKKGMEEKKALNVAGDIAQLFGKLQKPKKTNQTDEATGTNSKTKVALIEQLAFVSPDERKRAFELADKALEGEFTKPKVDDLLLKSDSAADIAMFGRMIASNTQFNREAAVQVSHAFTTNRAIAEDDYYTALDDLKEEDSEDAGAGFLGVQEFGSGVFYLYVCVDLDLLKKNLNGNEAIYKSSIDALVTAAATVAPGGKQNSFASRPYAEYILAERGTHQPRTLAAAFLSPIRSTKLAEDSITKLKKYRTNLENVYGPCSDDSISLDVISGTGSLQDVKAFALNS